MMKKIAIIGSDSFIAGKFINAYINKYSLKLFARKPSATINEILFPDLKDIKSGDLDGVDVVINFAAIVHQPNVKDESIYIRVNTELPIHLATQSKKAGVKHFIQMSTIAVYGEKEFINEKSNEEPLNIYGKTKLEADKQLLKMQDDNFKVSIIRPPMVYGGGRAPGNLQSLIVFAQKGFPLPFKGVANKRDFIHVNNLVQALHSVIDNKIYGIVIPTDKKSVSTWEIINYIEKYSDKKIRNIKIPRLFYKLIKVIKHNTYSKVFGDLHIDCNLPETIYKPNYEMEEGIREMIESYQQKK